MTILAAFARLLCRCGWHKWQRVPHRAPLTLACVRPGCLMRVRYTFPPPPRLE